MAVAKTYQQWERVSKPYTSANGKRYIDVKSPSGVIKSVKWYTEAEYEKYYGEMPPTEKAEYSQKVALGFANGDITIFKGNTYEQVDWFRAQEACRYCKWWGWYVASTDTVPEKIPCTLSTLKLSWSQVGNGEVLKSESEIKQIVDSMIYDASPSEFQGEEGDRLELWITVTRALTLEGNFGTSNCYIMEDDAGNNYCWTTAGKLQLEQGVKYHLRGTVKSHKTYRNVKTTYLSRCVKCKDSPN